MLLFVDVENLYRSIGKRFNGRLDYDKYLRFLEDRFGAEVQVRHAYGSQKPKAASSFISLLKNLGFTTKFDVGIDWNVVIALTAMQLSDKGTLVVLGSNNRNLAPLVEALQAKGARTFICGCYIHPSLKNLSEYHEVTEDLLIKETPLETSTTA
jgi:uncharacterized LabA/DUF88 family protein